LFKKIKYDLKNLVELKVEVLIGQQCKDGIAE